MPPMGFESTISAGKRPQTYALDRTATGIGKTFKCSEVQIEKDMSFTSAFWMPVRPLKWCYSPWSDVSTRSTIKMGVILRICCELCLDLQHELKVYY